jgi:hypothetical protein
MWCLVSLPVIQTLFLDIHKNKGEVSLSTGSAWYTFLYSLSKKQAVFSTFSLLNRDESYPLPNQ